jgi:AcrR family transcriptional regulator
MDCMNGFTEAPALQAAARQQEESTAMSGVRNRQKLATQEKVLAAARRLLLTRPYEDVGVRDIAVEAGVATGTVIGAFGSKADLLNTIVIEDFLNQFDLIRDAVRGHETTLDRMVAIGMACVRYQEHQLPLLRASLAHSWIRSMEAESQVQDAVQPIWNFIRQELSVGVVTGELPESARLGLLVELLFDSVLSCYRRMAYGGHSSDQVEERLRARMGIVLGAGPNALAPISAQQTEHDTYSAINSNAISASA